MAEIGRFVLLPALFLFGLSAYLPFVPFIAALRGLALVMQVLTGYGRTLVGVLHRRTPEFRTMPPYRPQDEEVKAYRNYFFGPATRDLRQLLTLEGRSYATTVGDSFRAVTSRQFVAPAQHRAFTIPYGLTLYLGLCAGAALALPLLGLLFALHALVLALLTGGARLLAGTLRAVDRAVLWMKRLRTGMLCPHCFERVPYPAYDCPSPTCRRRHADIRPGTYGIFRRRCECGQRMPTLLMLMGRNSRLQAYCVHPHCGKPMNTDAGHMPEVVIPLIGGQAAGKTQLMAAMLLSLEQAAANGGPAIALADEESDANYQVLREVLRMRGHTRATQKSLPRAHSFVLGGGRSQRLIHLFDTAGERFVDREDTDALRYARAARTFVFVLDPMAVKAFWTTMDPPPGPLLDRTLGSTVDPEEVFARSVQAVAAMGAPLQRSRLAVAISKTDLLAEHGLVPAGLEDSDGARTWLREALGLHSLVQGMELNFREVHFFRTAAVADEEAGVDASVAGFVEWCLRD
ncbi:TRAFAC clade GTPase domain-containing protein [Streptomyces sp. NRRL S-448]|uniref:TRAFAC clade GTPase domain-containing protein n=1 Tax=Streptomyces sp. NRRL S-448 TaxID=1463907 RepID=UPI000AAEC575